MNKLCKLLKNELNITWDEDESDIRLNRIVDNAKIALNEKLGAEIDYTEDGREQELFLAYCVYIWNNCANEFDDAYLNEIYQIRQKYEVLQYAKNKDNEF